MKSISQIVLEIQEVASSATYNFGGVTALSLSLDNFQHHWVINSDEAYSSHYKLELDDISTAVEIIHQFSKEPKEEIKEGLKSLSTYTEKPPFYLHYFKTLKNSHF